MNNIPLEFRAGSAGIGIIAGCSIGVGILTPVSLHSIPVIGQIAGSVATSLRQLDSTFGGLGWRITSALNSRAKPLGLRAGTGCGVAIGYGWGAGLMLKPTALESLSELIKNKIPPSLAAKLQGAPSNSITGENGAGVASAGVAEAAALKTLPPLPPLQSSPSSAELEKEVAALMKIVLQQEVALEQVNQKVESLQLELSQKTTLTTRKK